MYHFYRTTLITLLWFSLLVAPYALIAYLCYAGLCGGAEAEEVRSHPFYMKMWSYYIWLYPLIVFICLYLSRRFSHNPIISMLMLCIPMICLIPFVYLSFL